MAETKTKRYYTGITINPKDRIKKHNLGDGAKFAIDQGPFRLIYTSKPFNGKSEARKREIQIKGWRREKKEKLINGEFK